VGTNWLRAIKFGARASKMSFRAGKIKSRARKYASWTIKLYNSSILSKSRNILVFIVS